MMLPVGSSPQAVLNCIFTFITYYSIPRKVVLFPSPLTYQIAVKVARVIRKINPEIGVETHQIEEANINSASAKISEKILDAKKIGLRVAVDVTPGRKTMSLAAYRAAQQAGADLTLYLHLTCPEYQGEVYPNIPKHCIKYLEIGGQHEA